MKAKLISINVICSLMSLTTTGPLWLVMICVCWFALSVALLNWADRKGWMDEIMKRYNLDEL